MSISEERRAILEPLLARGEELRQLLGAKWAVLLDKIHLLISYGPEFSSRTEGLHKEIDYLLFDLLLNATGSRDLLDFIYRTRNELENVQYREMRRRFIGPTVGDGWASAAPAREYAPAESAPVRDSDTVTDGEWDPGPAPTFPPVPKGPPPHLPGAQSTQESAQPQSTALPDEKTINVWISGLSWAVTAVLKPAETYLLNFKVGNPEMGNLVSGDATMIQATDIPDEGLETQWVVSSSTIRIDPPNPGTGSIALAQDGQPCWIAQFDLNIPKKGESKIVQLPLVPQIPGLAVLDILIYSRRGGELYRQFQIDLPVGSNEPGTLFSSGTSLIRNDLVRSPSGQLDLATTHEWTTPPGELNIAVLGSMVYIRGDVGPQWVDKVMLWPAAQAKVAGPIENVLADTEKFRTARDAYLNDLDDQDILGRLTTFQPEYDWSQSAFRGDVQHQKAWDEAAASPELHTLAYDGYVLFDSFFPLGSELRSIMDDLVPGQRINISWLDTAGPGFIPHIPWGLFYVKAPIDPTTPVDGALFMGLRFRIDYTSHAAQAASKALGKTGDAWSAHLLYWGNNPQDPAYIEKVWQEQQLSSWSKQIIVPGLASTNAKRDLLNMLNQPTASPLALIYFFCHCSVGDGNNPVLRFGPTSAALDVLSRTELGLSPLVDRPLVFANACSSSTADPYMANELEAAFFRRGCRAYLGTETKVPIRFASRFASIFFHFFYRKVDAKPMAAGEAVAQTRRWLWTQYRNIGGLLYSYINQYELFMATPEELRELRK